MEGNGTREPVTLRTLDDKLATVRAETKAEFVAVRGEQKSEHTKTRAWVAILAAPSIAKALPFVLGYYFGWHPW